MEHTENKIDLRRLWTFVKRGKWIYLILIIIFTSFGIWKSATALPKYEIVGQLLVGEIGYDETGKAGGISQMMKTFSVGGFGAAAVDNELIIMNSHDVMLRTVRMLGLNRKYIGIDSDGKKAALYKNSPILVEAPVEFFDTLTVPFKIKLSINENGTVNVKAVKGFFNRTIAKIDNARLPVLLETPCGNVQLIPTDRFQDSEFRDITVTLNNNDIEALMLSATIEIDVATKLSDVIEVNYKTSNASLGKATVNGVMSEYNAKRLERLHESSVASIKYYDERIAEAFVELQKTERAVSDYQRANELMGIDSELGLLVGTAVGNKPAIMTANYNIAYHETVLDILRNRLNDDVIIPQMESLNDPHIEEFNAAIQLRRDLKRSATENNAALIRLNEKLNGLRDIIIENSEKMIAKARADVQHQQELTNVAQNRLDKYPDYELEFKNLLRDKEYQNALYQYLLQSRESSVLQLYSSTNIGYIFQPAFLAGNGSVISIIKWPLALFIFAIFLSLALAIIYMQLNNKISAPVDLAFLGIDNNTMSISDIDSIARMRALLTANPDRRIIYSANFSDNNFTIDNITQSLAEVGYSVEVVNHQESNDYLLSPVFANEIKRLESIADYIIINIPQPERVFEFEHIIDSSDANLLLTITENMNRKKLKNILKGQTINRIYTLIVK